MKLRILIFEQDEAMQKLLSVYLEGFGHVVESYRDPSVCPLYKNALTENCVCSQERPCGDVILIDMWMPSVNAFDFLKLQRQRGCKAPDANKAIMHAKLTKELEGAMRVFGCHFFQTPLRLNQVGEWVEQCALRAQRSVQQQEVNILGADSNN